MGYQFFSNGYQARQGLGKFRNFPPQGGSQQAGFPFSGGGGQGFPFPGGSGQSGSPFPGGGGQGFPFPGGGSGQSGFPLPGGGQQGFPGGGAGQQEGAPTTPPPSFVPQESAAVKAVDPGGIRGCLHRFTFIWLNNGHSFWLYPTYVGRTSIAGYRWSGFRWQYYGTDLRRIRSFRCF